MLRKEIGAKRRERELGRVPAWSMKQAKSKDRRDNKALFLLASLALFLHAGTLRSYLSCRRR